MALLSTMRPVDAPAIAACCMRSNGSDAPSRPQRSPSGKRGRTSIRQGAWIYVQANIDAGGKQGAEPLIS